MFKQTFKVIETIDTSNGFGGISEEDVVVGSIQGYIDMLSGNEFVNYQSSLESATHVLLTGITDITTEQFILDANNNRYNITFVDNPVGRGHHLEIYLEFVGDYDEVY